MSTLGLVIIILAIVLVVNRPNFDYDVDESVDQKAVDHDQKSLSHHDHKSVRDYESVVDHQLRVNAMRKRVRSHHQF